MFKKKNNTNLTKTLDDFWDYVLFDKAEKPRKPGEAMVQIARIVIGCKNDNDKENLGKNLKESSNKQSIEGWNKENSRLNKAYKTFKTTYNTNINQPPLSNITNECDLQQCTPFIQKFISEEYNEKIENKLSQKNKKKIDTKKMFMGEKSSMKLRATNNDFIKFLNKHNKTRHDYILPKISNVKQDDDVANRSYENKNDISAGNAEKAVKKAIKSKERRKKKGIIGKLSRAGHAIKKGIKYPFNSEKRKQKRKLLKNDRNNRLDSNLKQSKETIETKSNGDLKRTLSGNDNKNGNKPIEELVSSPSTKDQIKTDTTVKSERSNSSTVTGRSNVVKPVESKKEEKPKLQEKLDKVKNDATVQELTEMLVDAFNPNGQSVETYKTNLSKIFEEVNTNFNNLKEGK